ncbi:unnamed protein product [Parajaminaea phylloscopi]
MLSRTSPALGRATQIVGRTGRHAWAGSSRPLQTLRTPQSQRGYAHTGGLGLKFSVALSALAGAVALSTSLSPSSRPLQTEAAPAAANLLPPKTTELHKDPSTSLELPKRISVPAALGASGSNRVAQPFVLIASGVRTVSFLRVQVYVAALYVDEAALARFVASRHGSTGASTAGSAVTLEKIMIEAVGEGQVPAIIRIVPVRNTDFAHLRDGFTRAIQQRKKQWLQTRSGGPPSGAEAEGVEESLAESTQAFKACFPKSSLKKGQELDVVLYRPIEGESRQGVNLALEQEGVVLGRVPYDTRSGDIDVARLLLGAYVAEKDPVSPVFKKAVAEKLLPLFSTVV